jgi:hypothetical protein
MSDYLGGLTAFRMDAEGTVLMSCRGTYYQTSGSQYVVVYVD